MLKCQIASRRVISLLSRMLSPLPRYELHPCSRPWRVAGTHLMRAACRDKMQGFEITRDFREMLKDGQIHTTTQERSCD